MARCLTKTTFPAKTFSFSMACTTSTRSRSRTDMGVCFIVRMPVRTMSQCPSIIRSAQMAPPPVFYRSSDIQMCNFIATPMIANSSWTGSFSESLVVTKVVDGQSRRNRPSESNPNMSMHRRHRGTIPDLPITFWTNTFASGPKETTLNRPLSEVQNILQGQRSVISQGVPWPTRHDGILAGGDSHF